MKKLFILLLAFMLALSICGLFACDGDGDVQGDNGVDNMDAVTEQYFNLNLIDDAYEISLKPTVQLPDVLYMPTTYNQKAVSVIAEDGFKDSAVKNVIIPSSITEIKNNAFMNCVDLESIMFAQNSKVAKLGGNVFYGCTSIVAVALPDSITEIDYSLFYGCTSLENVTLSNGLKKIGDDPFKNCNALNTTQYDNAYYVGSATNPYFMLVSGSESTITSCTIHADTVIIGPMAFNGYNSLAGISIPNKVVYLGYMAFTNCDAITELNIPDNVLAMGGGVFWSCDNLATVSIGAGLENIGNNAFKNCVKLNSVTFAENCKLKRIEWYAFFGDYMLASFTVPASVELIEQEVFKSGSGKLLVTFVVTDGWSVASANTPDEKTPYDATDTETNAARLRSNSILTRG